MQDIFNNTSPTAPVVKSRQEKMNDHVDYRLDEAIESGLHGVVNWTLEYAELAYKDYAAASTGSSDVYFQARTVIDKLKAAHYKDVDACTDEYLKRNRRNPGELGVAYLLECLDKGRPPRLIVNELCNEYLERTGYPRRKPAASSGGPLSRTFAP